MPNFRCLWHIIVYCSELLEINDSIPTTLVHYNEMMLRGSWEAFVSCPILSIINVLLKAAMAESMITASVDNHVL